METIETATPSRTSRSGQIGHRRSDSRHTRLGGLYTLESRSPAEERSRTSSSARVWESASESICLYQGALWTL